MIQQTALLSSTLLISSALCLSACDDKLQHEKSQQESSAIAASKKITLQKHPQAQDASVVLEPAAYVDTKENKADRDVGFVAEFSEATVTEKSQQEELILLDYSLNFEQLELKDLAGVRDKVRQELFRGIFEPEGMASKIDIETHFEGPHNENKEREMTADGARVEFKIDF